MAKVIFMGSTWEVPSFSHSDLLSMKSRSPHSKIEIVCGNSKRQVSISDIIPVSPMAIGQRQWNGNKGYNFKPSNDHPESKKTGINDGKNLTSAKPHPYTSASALPVKPKKVAHVRVQGEDITYILVDSMTEDEFMELSSKNKGRTKVKIRFYLATKMVQIGKLYVVSDPSYYR